MNTKEPLLIIYSHTEYRDILDVASSFLNNYENKLLLINKDFDETKIQCTFSRIIKYDNSVPYASRLLYLNEINEEYFIFMHETDVLIKYDTEILLSFQNYMMKNNIDKIELQHCAWPPNAMPLKKTYNKNTPELMFKDICCFYKISNPDFFVYNVNPTIWKKLSLMKIMNTFKTYNYRDIEKKPIQEFTSKNFICLSLKCDKFVKCAYFTCPIFFQFIHLTHYGLLANIKDTIHLDKEINDIYNEKIYDKFLKISKRKLRPGFPL